MKPIDKTDIQSALFSKCLSLTKENSNHSNFNSLDKYFEPSLFLDDRANYYIAYRRIPNQKEDFSHILLTKSKIQNIQNLGFIKKDCLKIKDKQNYYKIIYIVKKKNYEDLYIFKDSDWEFYFKTGIIYNYLLKKKSSI